MRLSRPARIVTGWLASLALLFAALAPTLALAAGARPASDWVEVCTAQGSAWVQADTGGGHDGANPSHPFEHCPFCAFQAHGLGLPPALPALPLLDGAHYVAAAFLAAPRTLPAWVRAQPRAPPSIS